jgi:hypothetical protein
MAKGGGCLSTNGKVTRSRILALGTALTACHAEPPRVQRATDDQDHLRTRRLSTVRRAQFKGGLTLPCSRLGRVADQVLASTARLAQFAGEIIRLGPCASPAGDCAASSASQPSTRLSAGRLPITLNASRPSVLAWRGRIPTRSPRPPPAWRLCGGASRSGPASQSPARGNLAAEGNPPPTTRQREWPTTPWTRPRLTYVVS